MIRTVLNDDHLEQVLGEALASARHRLFIATADLKDLHVPQARGRARSLLELLKELAAGAVQVALLHSGVPSGPVLERLREGLPPAFVIRRCPRVHAKAVIVDGRRMYLGSANLTGAGLGAKSARRRNFEAGIWTDELALIDPVQDMLATVWSGEHCEGCGRREHCPVPLEEPDLGPRPARAGSPRSR